MSDHYVRRTALALSLLLFGQGMSLVTNGWFGVLGGYLVGVAVGLLLAWTDQSIAFEKSKGKVE